MNRRLFLAVAGLALWLTDPTPTVAQDKIPRIGFLTGCVASFDEQAFKRSLSELGYVEGKTVSIEWRRILEDVDQLRSAADELVRSKVDVIVTCSTVATRAALDATHTIPIVFTATADPIAAGLAASLAKPGGNATGVSLLVPELYPKRLDLLRQVAPHVRRVAFIMNPSSPGTSLALKPLAAAAKTLNIRLQTYKARTAGELETVLRTMPWASTDGVLAGGDHVIYEQGASIAQAVRKARVPAVFPWRGFHEYGVLMSYGPDPNELMRRGAYYVDKILKGAKPSDLPIEQVSKVDLVISLRVAREMGIKVPQELLYRADEVIR